MASKIFRHTFVVDNIKGKGKLLESTLFSAKPFLGVSAWEDLGLLYIFTESRFVDTETVEMACNINRINLRTSVETRKVRSTPDFEI